MGFQEKLKKGVSKGLEHSKSFFGAAKDKAKELGDSGILRFEIRQLQDKIKKDEHALGHATYDLLVDEGKQSISKKTTGIKELIETLDDLHTQIAAKRILLADIESQEAGQGDKPEDTER